MQKPPGREFRKPGDRQGGSRQRSQGREADQVTVAGTMRKGQGQAPSGRESRKPGDRQGVSRQRSQGRRLIRLRGRNDEERSGTGRVETR